jgi:hypothetical protein
MQQFHIVHRRRGHFGGRFGIGNMLGDQRRQAAAERIINAAGAAGSDREARFDLRAGPAVRCNQRDENCMSYPQSSILVDHFELLLTKSRLLQ